VIFRGEIRDLK